MAVAQPLARKPTDLEPSATENEVSARLGRFRAHLLWPRSTNLEPKVVSPVRPAPHRKHFPIPFWLGVATAFVLGAGLATAASMELIPYVETAHVLGKFFKLKLTGTACLIAAIVLALLRRFLHR